MQVFKGKQASIFYDVIAVFRVSSRLTLENTGYVQQQDLHLETSTVREALRFSAVLRQPKSVSREEKYKYVEEVIKVDLSRSPWF